MERDTVGAINRQDLKRPQFSGAEGLRKLITEGPARQRVRPCPSARTKPPANISAETQTPSTYNRCRC
eukprot:10503021-Lingulodinium_polyedra.AAC.1